VNFARLASAARLRRRRDALDHDGLRRSFEGRPREPLRIAPKVDRLDGSKLQAWNPGLEKAGIELPTDRIIPS
jgi:hypothetical protein